MINVYAVSGPHWSQRRAASSKREALTIAREWRALGDVVTIEHTESHDTLEEWIEAHTVSTAAGGVLVPDTSSTPDRVKGMMTRRYGRPSVPDRQETAYWHVR